MSKGESQEQQENRGVRKSNRQKVPNPRYIEGINELKKVTQVMSIQNPLKTRKKGKNYDHSDNNQLESQQYSRNEPLSNNQVETWYNCVLPNNVQLQTQFIINSERHNRVYKMQPIKLDKKRDSSLNLLSLVQQAIQNANGKPQTIEQLHHETAFRQIKSKQINKLQNLQDMDGRLVCVQLQGNVLKMQHSQMPIEGHKQKYQQNSMQSHQIEQQYRKILQRSKILNTITILN